MVLGWIRRQIHGHDLEHRYRSVEERLFWRGLFRLGRVEGMERGEVGSVVRKIVDGYISMWKVRCGVMAKVKKVARENEFRERRQILVASGHDESKVRR